jgi:hypothetical protein
MTYLDVKEPNNPVCQSSDGLLETLHGGTINNGDYISLIEVLMFTGFVFHKVEKIRLK